MEKKNILFGLRPIIEAIEAGREFEKIYMKKGADGVLLNELAELCKEKHIRVQWVPVEKLNHLTRSNHQGAVGVTSAIEYVDVHEMLAEIPEGETPLLVIFDGVTDVRNFGAIARSAECAGVHGLIMPVKNSAPVNADSMKTSGRCPEYHPGKPRRQHPQHDQNPAKCRVTDRSGLGKERASALQSRPEQTHCTGAGQRRHGYFERGAQNVRRPAGHSAEGNHRVAQCRSRRRCHAVRSGAPAEPLNTRSAAIRFRTTQPPGCNPNHTVGTTVVNSNESQKRK